MIELRYRAHREIYRLTVDLENEAPQIFIGDQNISDLIHSHNFWEIVRQAEKIAKQDADDERGEYLHTMGYGKQ
jgi:hypothetical protein